jgi:hypothetical protein
LPMVVEKVVLILILKVTDNEVMRFAMTELSKHIGANTDACYRCWRKRSWIYVWSI